MHNKMKSFVFKYNQYVQGSSNDVFEHKNSKKNITTQSVASPRTPHLSLITIVTFTFEL